MISGEMNQAINSQINAELYSAYLYLAMSAYAQNSGLPGVAHWLFIQMQEELTHVQRFYQYVNRVGGRVILEAVAKPPADFDSPLSVFEQVLEHERKVTGLINDLMDLAVAEKDHATVSFLKWFVDEQVEEEESANDILAELKLAGVQGGGLFMIDRELGSRVFTAPADLTA